MTDGIIQQVFKQILDRPRLKDADREQLEELQQELIEKIVLGNFLTLDNLKVLIGDNKE